MVTLYYAIGAVIGLLMLLPFFKSPVSILADIGYLALVSMLMIYLGAHLVSGDLIRILAETVFALSVSGLALLFRLKWPIGIGALILSHGIYDFGFAHVSGVVGWYPPLCVGFDVVVGFGLIILILIKRNQAS